MKGCFICVERISHELLSKVKKQPRESYPKQKLIKCGTGGPILRGPCFLQSNCHNLMLVFLKRIFFQMRIFTECLKINSNISLDLLSSAREPLCADQRRKRQPGKPNLLRIAIV